MTWTQLRIFHDSVILSFAGSCTLSKEDYLGCSRASSRKSLMPLFLPCLCLGPPSTDEVGLGVVSSGREGEASPTTFPYVQRMDSEFWVSLTRALYLLLSELLALSSSLQSPWHQTWQQPHRLRGTPALPNSPAPWILLLLAYASSSPWMAVAVFTLLPMSLCPPTLQLWYQLRSKGLGSAHQMDVSGQRISWVLCEQMQGRINRVNIYVEIVSARM